MTILQNMFVKRSSIQRQSMSVISNFLPERMALKSASFNPVLPHFLRIRSFCCNHAENRLPKSSTSEEEAWKERVNYVTMRRESYFDTAHWITMEFLTKSIKLLPMEQEKFSYRQRWATHRLVNKIEDIGRRLIDENVDDKCRVLYLADQLEKWMMYGDTKLEVINIDQCWLSLLESSEHQLAHKLREDLKEASITPVTFSKSVSKVYMDLQGNLFEFGFWSLELVDFGLDDIKEVLNDLSLTDTEYKCIKILFNLEESEKWQIKDREKV